MLNVLVEWLGNSAISAAVMKSAWAWPVMEIAHFLGLSLLLGGMLVVDLALLGFLRGVSLAATHAVLRLALIGFAINAFTGVLFVIGDPGRYLINIGFLIKMVLIFLAGLNALWYGVSIARRVPLDGVFEANGTSQFIGGLSLLLWFGVLACGRLIPYVGTG